MADWLSQLSVGQMIALVAITGGVSIPIVSVIAAAWVRVRRAEAQAHIAETEAALKQQMIERGMSADEIVQVLAAGQSKMARQRREAEEPAH